jgi:hypothetical protein
MQRLGLHVINFPSGRWGFVGSIPTNLCEEIPANTNAILGCRTHKNANGEACEWKAPSFETEREAMEFALSRGCEPSA